MEIQVSSDTHALSLVEYFPTFRRIQVPSSPESSSPKRQRVIPENLDFQVISFLKTEINLYFIWISTGPCL